MRHGEANGARGSYPAIIPAGRATLTGQPQCIGTTGEPLAKAVSPLVELVRENGVIQAIDITCVCGERIRVRCVYD